MSKKKVNLYPYSFTVPAIAIYFIFYVLSLIAGLFLAFSNWNIDNFSFKGAIPDLSQIRFIGLDNFASIFNDRHFSLALKNTLLFAFLTTLIKMVAGLFLALALHRSLKTRHILRTVFYLPGVLSMVVIGILFSALLRMDGMINEWLNWIGFGGAEIDWLGNPKIAMFSIIASEVWRWSGFVMTVFLAGLQGIPKDYYEAATIDGAGAKRRFLHITLPLLAPAFTVNLTMCIIGGFKVFEQVLVLTNGGPGYATQVLNTIIYQTFSEGWLAKSTAMELVLFAFIVVLTLIVSSLSRRREVEM